MSKRDTLSTKTDAITSKVLPEGFYTLVTSAGNTLNFHGPAERLAYQQDSANAAQLGKNRGEGDVRGK